MLISVCIPHYNRAKYLLVVLESIRIQDYPRVEVIISDDCSSDESAEVIPKFIEGVKGSTQVDFKYIRQPKNLGYDGNLRAALGAGNGEYLFVLGNDDALPDAGALWRLVAILDRLRHPDVCFANFHVFGHPGEVQRRARTTGVIGSGPEVAVQTFRSFSFVGGLAFKRVAFEQHNTEKYDGTVYVQIFLGARIIASGGTVAAVSESLVAKDVSFPGEEVNSYLDTLAQNNRTLHREFGGLDQVALVAYQALSPYIPKALRQRYILKIYAQLLLFTYPHWLLNYRKNGVYRASVNLALGCFPPNLVKVPDVSVFVHLCLMVLFAGSTALGLILPVGLLGKMAGWTSYFSKRFQPQPASVLKTEAELPIP